MVNLFNMISADAFINQTCVSLGRLERGDQIISANGNQLIGISNEE